MASNLKFMSYLKPKWKEYCNYVKCNTYIQHLSHDIQGLLCQYFIQEAVVTSVIKD